GGRITVSLAEDKEGKTFLLTVADTGIGIPKAEQGKIFTKFERASNAQLAKPDGTGLGMYIAWQATNLLGGSIRFESVENKGTTFFVTLPTESKKTSTATSGSDGKSLA
ncbi:MAG: ATP-binding protein, partial [Candidatus Taylorbacteria bacterium]|nr:ATP-binding protein [Candidatus Taylorbacteria bacterium]